MPCFRLVVVALCLLGPGVARAADDSVDLYLQPLPADAAKLTFSIASVSALAASGSEYPLAIRLSLVGAATAARQRLVASGRIPAGNYAGFALAISRAAMKSERGDIALPLPESPITVSFPFTVSRGRASLFWLVFRNAGAGGGFDPVFSGVTPPKPMVGRAGFVTSSQSNTVTVFDKHLEQAVAAIETCAEPAGMALDQRRRQLFVACRGDDEIDAIDVAAGEIVQRARVSTGDRPTEVALTPDGRTLVSVNTGSNSVTLFDAMSLAVLERVPVGSGPASVAIDPGGARAFVFNALSSFVSVVDLTRKTVIGTIPTESSPLRGQFNARGDQLFVIHERIPYVTVIDPVRLTTINRARVSGRLQCIKADNRRDLLYVGGPDDTLVEFYNPTALLPVGGMKTTGGVSYLTIDAEEDRLYMVSPDTRTLVIGSIADRKVVVEIDVGEGPRWVSVMGEK